LSVYNPADGSLVADDIPLCGEDDVDLAVEFATAAFEDGPLRDMSASDRRKILQKFASLIR
jgi:aldehyde dehydrogenase (NAD+)